MRPPAPSTTKAVPPAFCGLAEARNRPGLNALLERAGEFDVVVAESLDRLSRDQEDIAGLYKRLRFAGVRIVTLSEGEVSELHIGLKGTMGALFLKDLGDTTRRGQVGRASHRDASRAASATATAAW